MKTKNKASEKMIFKFTNKKILFFEIFFWVCLLCMAVVNSVLLSPYTDFFPINGDFQNYNPIRRILSGQIPFTDFEVYLGMGHAYLGAVFTKLLGGTFYSSLIAMKFLTFMSYAFTIYIICSVILQDKVVPKCITLLLCAFDVELLKFKFFLEKELLSSFGTSRVPGNSARYIRSSICVITPILALGIYYLIIFICSKSNKKIDERKAAFIAPGIAAGFSVFWSNDYGISSATVIIGASLILAFVVYGKQIKNFFISVSGIFGGFIVGGGILLLLITGFHPMAYIDTTMGVSSYQPWYAIHDPEPYAYYVWDLFINDPYVIFSFVLIVLYLIFLFKKPLTLKTVKRYGIPAIILSTGFFALHLYRLSDGGGKEYFLAILLGVCAAEIGKFLLKILGNKIKLYVFVMINLISVYATASITVELISSKLDGSYSAKGTYVEGLGGKSTKLGETINKTGEKLKGNSVFGTYSSAVEVVTGQFQPSGVDYIIHVLGDEKREEYINSFNESKPDYVGTIREDYTGWEGYARSANWFFYREFFNKYAISFSSDYQYYYKMVDKPQKEPLECDITIDRIDDGSAEINILCDSTEYSGIADVKLNYIVEKKDESINWFNFKQILFLHDTHNAEAGVYFSDFALPGGKEYEFYIPVKIVDGAGSMLLKAYPIAHTNLIVDNVECEGIFQNALDIANITEYEVSGDEVILKYTTDSSLDIDKVYAIQHEGNFFNVLQHMEDESESYLIVANENNLLDQLDDMSAVKLISK